MAACIQVKSQLIWLLVKKIIIVKNETAYTWDWYCHLVVDRASLFEYQHLLLLETSVGQYYNLYLFVVHFFNTSVNQTFVSASDSCFPALVPNSCCSNVKSAKIGPSCHDTQHNSIQHNDSQHKGLISDTQHK